MTTEPTPKPVTDLLDSLDLWREITVERRRAHEKHREHSMEGLDVDSPRRLAVLVEEVGEVARELNERPLRTWPRNADNVDALLRAELVQVAAMAVAWIAAIDGNPLTSSAVRCARCECTPCYPGHHK